MVWTGCVPILEDGHEFNIYGKTNTCGSMKVRPTSFPEYEVEAINSNIDLDDSFEINDSEIAAVSDINSLENTPELQLFLEYDNAMLEDDENYEDDLSSMNFILNYHLNNSTF